MKILLAIVAVYALFAVPSTFQRPDRKGISEQDSTTHRKQSQDYKNAPSTAPVTDVHANVMQNQAKPMDINNPEPEKNPDTEHRLVSATIALVVVGALQVVTLCFQIVIMRQHKTSLEQLARAASLNAQAVIHADRPWITIVGVAHSPWWSFKAYNLGRTPAEIISFSAEFMCVEDIDQLPAVPEYKTELVPEIKLLVPSPKREGQKLELLSCEDFKKQTDSCARTTDKTVHALMSGPKLSLFYFRVVYANALSRQTPDILNYETRMCFKYSPSSSIQMEVCGGKPYNDHT